MSAMTSRDATRCTRLGDRYLVTMGPAGNTTGAEYHVPLNEVLQNPNTSPEDLVTLTDVLLSSFGQYSDNRRRVSSGNVKFQCNHCGETFNLKHQVKKHLDNHQGGVHRQDNNTVYVCYECGKVYPRPENLNRHTSAVHRYIRQHACPECGEEFGRASEVDLHRKQQHPYSIVTVDMQADRLADEMEKDCNPGKRVRSQDDESDEMMSESASGSETEDDTAPVKCKKCGRQFQRAVHLKRHMRVHAADKQFECPFSCGCSYTNVSYLRSHIATVHDDVVHRCSVCGKFFETEVRLENHSRTHVRTRTGRQRKQEDDCDWRPHT